MNDIIVIFAFLRYCLGEKENMNRVVTGINWHLLFSFASKQACLDFALMALNDLGRSILMS